MKILILKLIGGVSLVLGVLGAFLPLLPSTCFMLLATWAFSKSSPRFHDWLYYHSPFSESIQNWQQHHVIPQKVKVLASASMITSFVITAMIVSNVVVLVLLGVGMIALLAYLLTRPGEVDGQLKKTCSYESHQLIN
ncbi:MAG: YbaN family protein [Gammaproteobacteria bacterium]